MTSWPFMNIIITQLLCKTVLFDTYILLCRMCYVNHPRIGIWNCHKKFHNIHPTYASAAVHSASYPIVLSVIYIQYICWLYLYISLASVNFWISLVCVFSYYKLLRSIDALFKSILFWMKKKWNLYLPILTLNKQNKQCSMHIDMYK